MTSRDFCYWLQGYFEIASVEAEFSLTENQFKMIQKHLNLVFKHEIDPSMGDEKHQAELNKIHNNDAEGIKRFGPKPAAHYEWNIHGWYDPKGGIPRC